jgi:pimeloyl-ACP methyl ester carboxylesterase
MAFTSSHQPSEEQLEHANIPTFVIVGTRNPDSDPITEGDLSPSRPDVKLELIVGMGHYHQSETPEKADQIVPGFLGFLNDNLPRLE